MHRDDLLATKCNRGADRELVDMGSAPHNSHYARMSSVYFPQSTTSSSGQQPEVTVATTAHSTSLPLRRTTYKHSQLVARQAGLLMASPNDRAADRGHPPAGIRATASQGKVCDWGA